MTVFLFVFGLAIFLYAMFRLEGGIREFSGGGLKRWIVSRTSGPYKSAGYGVVVTAILQSSSMVSLLVLAFVSAGIMPLYNGIGVVLGANLGTTVTGWVVTIIGFKMNLQALVVPLLGIGAALNLGYIKRRLYTGIGKALFAFGLLIFGLDIMKDSVTNFANVFDLSALRYTPAWVYLLGGLVLAAVMQSSSAVMIIALSMLNSDIVQLTDAAAVVIGADLGTTSTTVLGSLGQSTIKKQLALAHVSFNLLVNSLAFLILLPMLPWLLNTLAITDPMFGLVTFHSAFNLFGLCLFLPILKYYTKWIQRLLPIKADVREEYFDVPVEVPEVAIASLEGALGQLCSDAINLNLRELELESQTAALSKLIPKNYHPPNPASFEQQYESLKMFEGDIIRYASKLQLTTLSAVQGRQVSQIIDSGRSMVYASKTLKDVHTDFILLHQAKDKVLGKELYELHHRFLFSLFETLIPLFFSNHDKNYIAEQIEYLSEINGGHYQRANTILAEHMSKNGDAVEQISTWFNLNHELHHYVRYMLSALTSRVSINGEKPLSEKVIAGL